MVGHAGEDKGANICKSGLTVAAGRAAALYFLKESDSYRALRMSINSGLENIPAAHSFATIAGCRGVGEIIQPMEGAGVMSAEMRQDPWGGMPGLQNEINRLFGNARESDSSSATAMWVPLVDIHEYADRFELYIDLPGVDPSTVDLTLEGGILTVSGERQRQARNAGEEAQGRRIERGHGRFHRRFVLPDTVDSEKVNAAGRHGVLAITIPKLPKATPRKIQIAP